MSQTTDGHQSYAGLYVEMKNSVRIKRDSKAKATEGWGA